jgi:GNAT superfamily N-acetyltransferase
MKHVIEIDGKPREISIRAMDESFIVYRKMYVPPLTPENIGTIAPHDDVRQLERFRRKGWLHVLEEFFRRQIRTIGSCAILAWDGDGVIGKMHFTTREMWDAFRRAGGWYCVDHESMPRIIQSLNDEEMESLLASPSRTLYAPCFNIGHFDARYQGKGIATSMIAFLKDWARQRNWQRIEMPSCPDVVPFKALGGHVLRQSRLEREGFRLVREETVSADEATGCRETIRRILSRDLWPESDWYMKFYRDDIERIRRLASDHPSWEADCVKDYVMGLDVSSQ